jgi:anti-anti-sigma regulatory factor
VVLDCEGINFLDSQGSASIDDLLVLCSQADVTLRLARVKPAVRATLEREGTIERLGSEHVHGNVHRAVEAQLSA